MTSNYLKKIGPKRQFSADFMLNLTPLLLKLSSNIREQVGNISSLCFLRRIMLKLGLVIQVQ